MSDYDNIFKHLDNNYDDKDLLDYTKRNGLYKRGMNRKEMLRTTTNALYKSGYRVSSTKDDEYHWSYRERNAASPRYRTYNNTSGNAEVAMGSRRRSLSNATPGEAEYQQLKDSGKLESYKEKVEANERSYQSGHRRSPRRSHHKAGAVPASPQDCPAGTYYREGYYRKGTMVNINGQEVPRRGSYVEATCASMPRGNPWWEEIHQFAKEHPGVSGAEAAEDLSREMAEGLIPHESEFGRKKYTRRSPRRTMVGSNNTAPAMSNRANVGASNMGSYGAGMAGTNAAALGSYRA
jgi:hypothetical protein